MKTRSGFSPITLLIALVACVVLQLSCTGCATTPGSDSASLVQSMLDRALPRDFAGDVHLVENFPGAVSLDVRVTGLRHNGTQWTWTSLNWQRHGVWTNGTLTLTPAAPAVK